MAINPEAQYPGKITPSSADYPYGEARNITIPGDGTGTPWEAALLNDIFGHQQSLLSDAGVVPSGTPEKVGGSQYLQSLYKISGLIREDYIELRTIQSTTFLILDLTNAYITKAGIAGNFRLDKSDTTTVDDGGLTIVDADGGRWKRVYSGPVNILWFGAVGDAGVTDNTTAIAAAFATGKDVFIPAVSDPSTEYYKLTSDLSGNSNQTIFGEGYGSILRQTTANTNVITVSSKTHFKARGLHLYAVGSISSINNGQGIHLDGCTYAKIIGNLIENHRGKGIGLKDTNNSVVYRNILINSPVVDGDTHDVVQGDISVYYSSNRNIVTNNHCLSGNGTGISIQSITPGDDCSDNTVTGNVVEGSRMYGLMAYRLNGADTLYRNKFIGNTVKDISGVTAHTSDGLVFGAGVYIQGAEYSIVSDNTIENTNINTAVDQLAPGAIGATNVTNVTVIGNTITNPNWYGITMRDPTSQGLATGHAVVSGNSIFNAGKIPIQIDERGHINVEGNTIDTGAIDGVSVTNSTATDPFINISENIIKNIIGVGVNVKYASQIKINGNIIDTCSTTGISVADSNDLNIGSNIVTNCTVRGIQNQATNISVNIYDNNVNGNGVGMLIQSAARLSNNVVESNTTDWQGDYQLLRTLGTGAATYDIKDAIGILVPTDGTAVDNLTGGYEGQKISLIATGTRTFNDTSGGAGQMLLSGNFATTSGDILKLEYWGTSWYEISRSVN